MPLTDDQAKEAAMNGAYVKIKKWPPYLTCPLCGGDGSGARPYLLECSGAHERGWYIAPSDTEGDRHG